MSVFALPTSATLILYEGFDYATGNDGLVGQSGGIGWGGSSWARTGSGNGSNSRIDVVSALSFSDYANTGNALRIENNNNNGGAYDQIIASRQLTGLSLAAGTTVYTSYLFRQGGGASFAYESGLRASDSSTNGGNESLKQTPVTLFGSNGPDEAAFGYDSTTNSSASAVTGGGTTYLVISKFENLGGAGAQNGSLWLLDTTNYDAIKAGGITELELDSNNVVKLTDSTTGISLGSSDFFQFFGATDFGIANQPDFDELKVFTDLSDLQAVPEPSAVILLIVAGIGLWGAKRLRSA
ncbi:MAG: PEP-CTERM sorting domain-containing protein [Verrucomicrobiota bacterium]